MLDPNGGFCRQLGSGSAIELSVLVDSRGARQLYCSSLPPTPALVGKSGAPAAELVDLKPGEFWSAFFDEGQGRFCVVFSRLCERLHAGGHLQRCVEPLELTLFE
jgi:hypothetical protein